MKNILLILTVTFLQLPGFAQVNPVPIGGWRCYLPYNGPTSVGDAGDKVYVGNSSSVYSFSKTDNSYDRLSKANGLNDVGVRGMFYGQEAKTLAVCYINSNIDFIIDGKTFNFNSIKTSMVSGDKNVYDAAFEGDTAILSCGFGIVLYDIAQKESPATYFFSDGESSIKVNSADAFENAIYAATANGIYRGPLDGVILEDFSSWELISGTDGLPAVEVDQVVSGAGSIYARTGDSVFAYNGATWDLILYEDGWRTYDLTESWNNLLITQHFGDAGPADSCRIITLHPDGSADTLVNDTQILFPYQSVIDQSGIIWIADGYQGLLKYDGSYTSYNPNGPGSSKVTDLDIFNNRVYVAPGEINASWNYLLNTDGFFAMNYGFWNNLNKYQFSQLDTVQDIITVAVRRSDEKVYLGSFGDGVIEYDPFANSVQVFNAGTSLQPHPSDPGSYRIGGVAIDVNGNVWISNYGAPFPLSVYTADHQWNAFECHIPAVNENQVGAITIDDFDQKWIQLPRGGGVLVYNHGENIMDETDDATRIMLSGEGAGNLTSNIVYCLVKDLDNEIWVGTDKGISIFYNPGEAFSGTTSGDAAWPLVNLGGYNEYLLSGETVNCITVDGANRKWVGTNSGVFLISEDGTEQLAFFNQENSPLLSNVVFAIAIDGITGDVYFGTDKGLVSYRYTATEGVEVQSNVTVFPNPVRPDYKGPIAISGLTGDAEVKITDISGRLIYETTALGGQAIWDGNGYNGKRAGTGLYMVYSMNQDGSQTYVAKVLVVN